MMSESPVRLCCGQRHYGAVCPDGRVMCCICFNRFAPEDLLLDKDGQRVDVCYGCHEKEINHE